MSHVAHVTNTLKVILTFTNSNENLSGKSQEPETQSTKLFVAPLIIYGV